jgi:hypothetical protein
LVLIVGDFEGEESPRSSAFRRDALQVRGELRVCGEINRTMTDLHACGIFAQVVVVFAICGRTNWARHEPSSAVRTNVFQFLLDTVLAKCAFVAADSRFERVGRKGLVAIFAGGS